MKHNQRFTGTYTSWSAMKQRCKNPNNPSYKNYGGKGISYAVEWENFEVFYRDMGDRPEGTELERKDNALGYFPGNCVWATRDEQLRNTSRVSLNEDIVRTAKLVRSLNPNSSPNAVAKAVASRFGVNTAAVLAALRGRSWVNVS